MKRDHLNNNSIIHALLHLKGINRRTVQKIYQQIGDYGDAERILFNLNHFTELGFLSFDMQQFLSHVEKSFEILQKLKLEGVKALCFLDEEYPVQLRHVKDFPVLLFVKGNLDVFNRRINVALVGTRKPSDTAKKATWRLGMKFSEYQCNIVSGLAMGCDTFAHESSITSGGKTLAVLPCGIYNIYPKSNIGLANRIIEAGGAIVSEYPVMHKPHKAEYIERDRIISALSDIVTVVESGRNGGTIHTANYAIEQDKILACFQHSKYTEESAGNKMLIEEKGAIPISIEDDIRNLTELANNRRRVRNLEKLTKIAPYIEKQLSFFD